MFLNQTHLEYVLEPRHYYDPEHFSLERKRVFHKSWYLVGCKAELARPGDFLTTQVLGKPIIVRNFDGELRAFLNVCAHRHCRLTHVVKGNTPKLQCQYHGWEYKDDGYTGHIPDAKIFRPIDREQAKLASFRIEICGSLVFVAIDEAAPALATFLGDDVERIASWFNDDFLLASHWTVPASANWKVLVENSLESYHVPLVHPLSFVVAPPEEICRHFVTDRSSTFQSDETLAWRRISQSLLVRFMGLPVTNVYTHHLAYPHLQFVHTDIARAAIMIVPVSATTCEQRVWVWSPKGNRYNPLTWFARHILKWVSRSEARRVLNEDAAILEDVQVGLEASVHRGVIGTREERIYALQKFLDRECRQ